MDRFKFRGKSIDTGSWYVGYYEFTNNCHFINNYPDSEEVDQKTIGQCTGLKDKNGVLIFEWDTLLWEWGEGLFNEVTIYWSKETNGWMWSDPFGNNMGLGELNQYIEITGNIHDE